jgi:hypothetical protein
MEIGDDAIAAGMDIVLGTDDRRNGYEEINKTRDYVAGVINSKVDKPGDGALMARREPGSAHSIGFYTTSDAELWFRPEPSTSAFDRRMARAAEVEGLDDEIAGKVSKAGDTMSGPLYLPTATAATSGYAVAYLNADGRVSRGASSERYKDDITAIDPASLGNIFPALHRFRMAGGDGSWRYGWIAERLAENPDTQPFVVYNNDGQPDSIDFIALLIAQNARLEQRISELENRA